MSSARDNNDSAADDGGMRVEPCRITERQVEAIRVMAMFDFGAELEASDIGEASGHGSDGRRYGQALAHMPRELVDEVGCWPVLRYRMTATGWAFAAELAGELLPFEAVAS